MASAPRTQEEGQSSMTRSGLLTADELAAEGERLRRLGNLIVYLHPYQEWLAVLVQTPFLRVRRTPA